MKERYINNNQNSKDYGRIAYLYRRDEKSGSVVLIYEDGNGKEGPTLAGSTFKRYWKKVKEDEVKQETVVEPEDSDVCGDGTPYTEVMKQIVKGAEKRAVQAKKEKAEKKSKADKPKKEKTSVPVEERKKAVNEFLTSNGFNILLKDAKSMERAIIIVDARGKKSSQIYLGDTKCAISMTATVAPDDIKPSRVANCPMSHRYDVSYDNLDAMLPILCKING